MIDLKSIKTIAVVGASNNPEKYGYKIVANLAQRGYQIFPINLKEKEIHGLKVYPNLLELPVVPDLVDIVVPPAVAIEVIKSAVALGVKNIWVQPGAESDEIENYLQHNSHINSVTRSCIMMN